MSAADNRPKNISITVDEPVFRQNPAVILIIDANTGTIVDANEAATRFYEMSVDELKTYGFGPLTSAPDHMVQQVLDRQENKKGKLQLKQEIPSGKKYSTEIYFTPFERDGSPLIYLIIHDISELKRAEQRLEAGEKFFKHFITHTPAAVALFDRKMRYMYTSRRWKKIFELDDQELYGRSQYEVMPDIPDRWREVNERSLQGEVLRCDEDYFTRSDGEIEWLRWESYPWYDEFGAVGGIIIFAELITDQKRATEAEARYARNKVRMAARMEAVEEERRHIARELHDGLGQLITAAHLNVELLEDRCRPEIEDIEEHTGRIREILNRTLSELRNISQDLRPSLLDDLGLVPALRNLAEELSQFTGIDIEFDAYEMTQRLPSRLETTIYRICQEALNNIARHSQAREASIQLYKRDKTIVLLIQDDGVGFDTEDSSEERMENSSGSGIINIRERIEGLGGVFNIESQPGQGTELIIEIPLATGLSSTDQSNQQASHEQD